MPDDITSDYYAARAAKERTMADLAATPAARTIHLHLAKGYDERARETSPLAMDEPPRRRNPVCQL